VQGKPQSEFAANFSAEFLELHQFSSPYRTYEENGKLKKLPAKSDYNTPPFDQLPSPPEKVSLHLTEANIAVADADHCFRKDGSPKPWAERFVTKYAGLTAHEFSASATGGHFLFELEEGIPKDEVIVREAEGVSGDDAGHTDLFVNTRWIALTGRPLFGRPHPKMMRLSREGLAALKAEVIATRALAPVANPTAIEQSRRKTFSVSQVAARIITRDLTNNTEAANRALAQSMGFAEDQQHRHNADEKLAIWLVRDSGFSSAEYLAQFDKFKLRQDRGERYTAATIRKAEEFCKKLRAAGPLFDSKADFERAGNPVPQIEGISYQGEATGNASAQKNGKSWYVMSKMRALLSGNDWFGRKVARAERVNYYVPEVGRASVYRRLRAMQLDQYLDRTLFVRTSALGVPDLLNEEVMESCAGADIFMDTLIRFLDGPENNAEVIKGFAEKVFALLAVARHIEINCHTQKSYANKDDMGPEMFRGSGDITAFLSNGYGLMQLDKVTNKIFVKCLFSRDLPEDTPSFILQGRDENGVSIIDSEHDFKLVTSDAGQMSEHRANPKLKNMTPEQETKLKEFHAVGTPLREIAEALGVKSHNTVGNWMKVLGLTPNLRKKKDEEAAVTDGVLDLIGGSK
jgi:AAA domain